MAEYDVIRIVDWEVACLIGVHPWERKAPRPLLINLTLCLTPRQRHDDLAQTVDYDALQQELRQTIDASAFLLLESLADKLAEVSLRHALVEQVTVRIGKPGALPAARTVEVEIVRQRHKREP